MNNLASVLYETTRPEKVDPELAPFIYSCSRCVKVFHSPREFKPKSVTLCPICRQNVGHLIPVDYTYNGTEKSAEVVAIYRPAGGGGTERYHGRDCDVEEIYVDGELIDLSDGEIREIELTLLERKSNGGGQ